MADRVSWAPVAAVAVGAVVGWVAGRWVPGYGGGYPYGGYPYGGHHEHEGHGCHVDKRLACLEAGQAANTVAIQKDEIIDTWKDRALDYKWRGELFANTCHKVDGELYVPTRRLADHYESEHRVIDSHPHHGRRHDCNRDWI